MLGIQAGLATLSHNRFKSQPDDDFIVLLLLHLAIAVREERGKGGRGIIKECVLGKETLSARPAAIVQQNVATTKQKSV